MSTRLGSNIGVTVDPNYKITTKEQALDLDRAFDEAFGSPLHETAPPVAPKKEPPAEPKEREPKEAEPKETPPPKETEPPQPKETPEPKEEPEPKLKPEEGKTEPEPDPDEEPDEELDKIRIHPDSREETVHVVRMFRGMVKQGRKQIKELQTKVQNQEQELTKLSGSVRPVSDPTVQSELEDLRNFRTKHQIFDDSIYQTNYEQPVRVLFDDIVKDVVALANNPEEAKAWEQQVRSAGPDRLDRNYWSEGVIGQCTDPLHRERLVRKISTLLEAQGQRDQFREQMSADPQAYEKFRHEQAADYWKTFTVEAEDEAKKIIPSLGEWANPKDLAMAKSQAERTAFEAHNKVHDEYENLFKKHLTDVATQGPRGMTRVAMAATVGEKHKHDLDMANKQIAKLQAELKGAQEELNKIAGVRSRVNGSSGTATASTKQSEGKPKYRQSVEDAFRESFGN